MKQRRLFLIAMAMFVVSCHSEIAEPKVVGAPSVDDQVSIYAISEEEAIENLNEFLAAFDVEDTRVNSRVVKSIEPVKLDNLGMTRASSDVDIDNLLYIVEFEDGQGSAVLGADRRLTPVYAVLDESVLTKEDFQNAVNGENIEDVSTFTAGVIANSLGSNATLLPPGGGLITDMYKDITTTTVVEYLPPLLDTKWEQLGIFNDKFRVWDTDVTDGRQCAGCTTIALAQILNNNSYPSPITLNGQTFYWRDINQFTWDNEEAWDDPELVDKMSSFIYCLAQDLDVTYKDDGSTGAGFSDVKRVMRQQNYSNLSVGPINESRVYPMLYNNRTVFAVGYANDDDGHAWVIDGWKSIRTDFIRITYNGYGVETSREVLNSTETDYVHCNMGYAGQCDGYYTMDLFDLSDRRITGEYESGYGDISVQYPSNYRFIYDLEALTYSY